METLAVTVLMAMLAVTAVAVIRLPNLYAAVMLFGIYSLVSASLFLIMDAADVAFTEAAVGAGVTTVLMLSTLALASPSENEKPVRRGQAGRLIVVALTGLVLAWGTLDLPGFGDPTAPAHSHVAPRYIEQSPAETGVANMVTALLASYRGFDTLGEVTVIFTAGVGLILLLGGLGEAGMGKSMSDQPVLRVTAKVLIPLIMLFALYVQFHGDFGPGGGFQAGVIFAASLILYALIFGVDQASRVIPPKLLRWLACGGLLLYGGVGLLCMVLGGNFLDYDVLGSDPVSGQHLGILLVELGVGLTVSSVMIIIFTAFAGRCRS